MFAIIDLEFTSWKGSLERNWKLEWEKREIIQIGSVKFNSFNGNLKFKNIYIKPKFNKNLSFYIQSLTKISQSTINEHGKDFKFAIQDMNLFFKDVKYIFCNGFDKEVFIENFEMHNLKKKKFLSNIYNIRPYLSKKLKIDEKEIISSELNNFFNFENISIKHNALNDSLNIFKCLKLLKSKNKLNYHEIISSIIK